MVDFDETANNAPSWYQDGIAALARGKADTGLFKGKKELKQAQQSSDKTGQEVALRLVIKASLAKGDSWNAKRVADELVKMAKANRSEASEAAASVLLGRAHAAAGEAELALKAAEAGRELYKKLGHEAGQAAALNAAALARLAAKDVEGATAKAEAAVEAFKAISEQRGQAFACWTIALAKVEDGRLFQAEVALTEMKSIYEPIDEMAALGQVELKLAEVYLEQRSLQQAVDSAASAAEYFEAVTNTSSKATAVMLMARAFEAAKDYKDTAQAAEVAASLYDGTRDKASQARALTIQGKALIKYSQSPDGPAVKVLEEATFLLRQLKDKEAEASATHALTEAKMMAYLVNPIKFPLESVQRSAQRTMTLYSELYGEKSTEYAQAQVWFAAAHDPSEWQTTIELMEASEAIFQQLGDLRNETAVKLEMARTYVANEKLAEARELMEKTKDCGEECGDPELLSRVLREAKRLGSFRGYAKAGAGTIPSLHQVMHGQGNRIILFDAFQGRTMADPTARPSRSSRPGEEEDEELPALTPVRERVLFSLAWHRMPKPDRFASVGTGGRTELQDEAD